MVNKRHEINFYGTDKEIKDERKMIIFMAIILLIVCIILTVNQIIMTIGEYKVYKQYEAQLNAIKYQEEVQVKIAEEQKKQEKIPKLTDERKKEYGEYI